MILWLLDWQLLHLINVALRLFFLGKYSNPTQLIKTLRLFIFEKIIEKLCENRKKWLFAKASLYSVTKIPGPTLVLDPSFIRFRYFFQNLRLFATLRLLER